MSPSLHAAEAVGAGPPFADPRWAPLTAMTLERSEVLEGGSMLLRYRISNAKSP
ncbi:hypothetical protein [Bradyrhizobium sp. CB3481]|uniref:hypothetical protein n=1 Tax=Bradyrhizobium sp. CB3481 TaxID=3039158 RepID=UPI0024B080A9|nr:hypothetical protein [Bradyrhizobium sp. CB3481]WFU14039.1 hypothetical protein QA643_22725 [Bradyrhizobium sp. CB3481]